MYMHEDICDIHDPLSRNECREMLGYDNSTDGLCERLQNAVNPYAQSDAKNASNSAYAGDALANRQATEASLRNGDSIT